jgi:hypothetical protein
LNITQEQLVQVSSREYGHTHLDFQFATRLYHPRSGLKFAYDLLWVIFLLPSEMSWKVTVVLEYQGCFLMLGLWVDIFCDSCIDATQVHAHTVQGHMWALYF